MAGKKVKKITVNRSAKTGRFALNNTQNSTRAQPKKSGTARRSNAHDVPELRLKSFVIV
jgi:hypothetical protein